MEDFCVVEFFSFYYYHLVMIIVVQVQIPDIFQILILAILLRDTFSVVYD